MNPLTPYLWLIKFGAAVLLVLGIAFGVWYYGHHRYEAGIAAQRAAEARSLAVYTKARDAQLASAEASYHAEIDNIRLSPVRLPVVRLCLDVPRGADTSKAAARTRSPTPSSRGVRGVPEPDHSVRPDLGPDIASLLAALAGRADRLSAQLRALIRASK